MLIIGLLIMAAAAVFAGVVLSENWGGTKYEIDGFGRVLGHLTLAQIFIAGIAVMAIFVLGLWAASVSSRMRRRASGRRRADTRAVREERDALIADRDRLAHELEAARASRPIDLDDRTVVDERAVDTRSAADDRPRVVSVVDQPAGYRSGEYMGLDGPYVDPTVTQEVRQHTV